MRGPFLSVAENYLNSAHRSRGRRRPCPPADFPARNGRGVNYGPHPPAGRNRAEAGCAQNGIAGLHHRKRAPPRRTEPLPPRGRGSARNHWSL
jgi:hypothetical protein